MALIFTALAAIMLIFGSWGRFTPAGKAKFDEMAGMIPLFSWYGGLGMAILALIAWGYLLFMRDDQPKSQPHKPEADNPAER